LDDLAALMAESRIRSIIHRYAALVDGGQFSEIGALFRHGTIRTADEEGVERQWTGAEAIASIFSDTVRTWDGVPRTKHLVSNVLVSMKSDTVATCQSYYTVIHEPPGAQVQIVISGRYHDRFELIDGEWQLVDRFVYSDLFGDLSSHMQQTEQITSRQV
jgi:3-phenylpropionate/cinnamic acid dioxygenase small subunit